MTAINGNILQWYKKARKFEKIISISVLDNPTSNYKVKEMSIINGNLITIGIDEVNNKSFIGIKGNYGYSDEYIKFEEFENTKILSLLCTDDKVIFITKTKVYTLDYNVNSDSFETTFKNFPLSENLNNEIKLIGDRNNIYFYDYNKIYEINITNGNISYILSAPENSLISSIAINNDKLIISRQLDNKLYIYNRTEILNDSIPAEYKIADDDVIPTLNSSTAMDLNQNVLSVGLSDGRLFIVNLDSGEESNIGSLFSEISYVDSNGSYSGFIDNEGSIIFYDRNLSKLITIEVNSRSIEGTLVGSNSKSIIDFKMDDIFLTTLNNDNTVDLYKLEYIPDLEFNYHMIEKRDGKGKENDTFFLDVNAKLVSDINNAMDKTPYEVELYTNIEKSYLSGDAWAKVDNFPEFVKGARPNVHRKSELCSMLSNNSAEYPNQGYWLTDTDGRLFFRTERMNLEKNPNNFSVYNGIGMDYDSNDPENSGSINTNLVGKKVIVSGKWRGSREADLVFMSKVIVNGVTKALPKDKEKIKVSTDWQTFSTVIDKVEEGTSIVRFLPSYNPPNNWETAEGFYLDQKDIKVEIVEEGESEEPTPWIPPITRKLFNPTNIFEGVNTRNPVAFQGSVVTSTKNVEVSEWGAKDASTFVITGGTSVIKGLMKVKPIDPPLQGDGNTFYRSNFHVRNNHETNALIISSNGGASVSIPPKAIGYFGIPTNQQVAKSNLQLHFQVDDPSMDINCTFWNPEFYAYDIEHGFTEKAPESAGSIIYDYEYVGKFDPSLGEDRDNPNNYHWSKRKQKISTKKLYQEIGLRKNLYLPLSNINDVFASNLSLYLDSNSNDNKSSIFYKIKNKNNNIEINNNEVKLDRIKKLFIKDLYKFGNDLFFRYMFICNNSYAVKLDFNNKASTLITFNESRELYKNIFNLFNPKSEFELKIINKVGLKQYTISNLIPKGKYTIRTDYINTTSQDKDIFFTNNSEKAPDSSYNGVDMNKSLTISANKEGKLFISLREESSGGKLLVEDLIEGRYNIYLEPALGGLTDSVTIVGNNGSDSYTHKMYSNDISFGDYDYSTAPNLLQTVTRDNWSNWISSVTTPNAYVKVFDDYIIVDAADSSAVNVGRNVYIPNITRLTKGKQYTLSVTMMVDNDFDAGVDSYNQTAVHYTVQSNGTPERPMIIRPNKTMVNQWQRVSVKFTVPTSIKDGDFCFLHFYEGSKVTGKWYIRNDIMIQEGDQTSSQAPANQMPKITTDDYTFSHQNVTKTEEDNNITSFNNLPTSEPVRNIYVRNTEGTKKLIPLLADKKQYTMSVEMWAEKEVTPNIRYRVNDSNNTPKFPLDIYKTTIPAKQWTEVSVTKTMDLPSNTNLADKSVTFPIKSSEYLLYKANMKEEYILGQTYTITLKGTKPPSQTFVAYNDGLISFGNLKPVEGLTDVWSLTFTPTKIASNVPKEFRIFQYPSSTVGTSQIDWLKIEKGETYTPDYPDHWLHMAIPKSYEGIIKIKNDSIKIQEGTKTTKPAWKPNLLAEPYEVGNVSVQPNIAPNVGLPVTTSTQLITQQTLKDYVVKGETYTVTLKGKKPANQGFRVFIAQDNGNRTMADMIPVEGLPDQWKATFTYNIDNTNTGPKLLRIYQRYSELGSCTIEWLKIEKNSNRTPNIESYDYIGLYTGDSNVAPNDPTLYRWNNFIGIDDKGHSYSWTGDIGKNEIYDISNYQDPFTKFHLFKLKNAFDIINDDKFNINITLYNNGKIIETSSINNLEYREVFPNKDIKYKTSDGDIRYIEELLLTELEQGNKDRFMHNNSLVPQNRVIPNSEISISNGTYVGEEVNDEGLTGYITIPFNARDIGDLYKSDYIIMDIYVNGYKLDRKYAKERYNLNDGSLRVDYPVKNIYRFISDDEYNQISSGNIPDSVKFIATIRRKSLISSEKVIGTYRVTDQFQNDIEMLQSTGIYIPFVGKDSDLTSSELRLFIRNKVNSLARRVNPDNYTMRLDKQNKQVLVKLNGTTNIEIGSEIIIASNGLLDNNIYYINNNRDYPMDSLPLVTFDSENNMYTGLIYDEEDIDISVNGLTLIPKRDYNILDPDIDSIPSMITFKNYIPLGSTIEINYLEEKTNHVFNWDNPAYGTQNRFVLDDDRFIFVKGTFELFVNNLKLDNESFNIINNRTIEIINIEPKYLKNVMVRFSYRDHTNLKLIQDSYKFNNIDINENGYHSKFEGKSPNNFDKLSNGVSTDISKILLMNKLNTNDKLVIDCNDDNLQSDIYLDSRYIDNQYINRNISINANSINRINEDNSISNPEI